METTVTGSGQFGSVEENCATGAASSSLFPILHVLVLFFYSSNSLLSKVVIDINSSYWYSSINKLKTIPREFSGGIEILQ